MGGGSGCPPVRVEQSPGAEQGAVTALRLGTCSRRGAGGFTREILQEWDGVKMRRGGFGWSVCPDRGGHPQHGGGALNKWVKVPVSSNRRRLLCARLPLGQHPRFKTGQDLSRRFLWWFFNSSAFPFLPAFALLRSYMFHQPQSTGWELSDASFTLGYTSFTPGCCG